MRPAEKYLLSLLFLTAFLHGAKAQDPQFTQFYASPLYLNPAFTGADVCSRASFTYRNQWPGISTAYHTYLFSLDHYFSQYNTGAGLLIASDVAGTGSLKTTTISGMMAYEAVLAKNLSVRFGVQPGIGIKSINFNELLFGDQIARGGNVPTLEAPAQNTAYFDVSAGGLVYSKKYWLGFSAFHLNTPNESLLGLDDKLPMRISLHGGGKYVLNPDEKEADKKKYISPAFNYMHQNKFDQLDLGFYYTQNVLNIGIWYRGIPYLKAYKPGYPNNDAIALLVGVTNARTYIGYSYDITISQLSNVSQGAHEISLSYQMCKAKKKKKRIIVPCPKF